EPSPPIGAFTLEPDNAFHPADTEDLDALVERIRNEREPVPSSADFIAAARRATQVSSAEAASGAPARPALSKVTSLLPGRKTAIATAGVAAIALIVLQLGTMIRSDPVELAAPATTEAPRTAAAPASYDPDRIERAASEPESIPQLVDREATVAAIAPTAETLARETVAPSTIEIGEIPAGIGPEALREAASGGDLRALFEIGSRYGEGRGVPLNLE